MYSLSADTRPIPSFGLRQTPDIGEQTNSEVLLKITQLMEEHQNVKNVKKIKKMSSGVYFVC